MVGNNVVCVCVCVWWWWGPQQARRVDPHTECATRLWAQFVGGGARQSSMKNKAANLRALQGDQSSGL